MPSSRRNIKKYISQRSGVIIVYLASFQDGFKAPLHTPTTCKINPGVKEDMGGQRKNEGEIWLEVRLVHANYQVLYTLLNVGHSISVSFWEGSMKKGSDLEHIPYPLAKSKPVA